MHVVTNVFGLLGIVLAVITGLLALGVSFYIGRNLLREATFRGAADLAGRQSAIIEGLRKDIRSMQEMVSVQEKRINRAELEAHRKERLLFAARQEITYFEDALAVILPALTRLNPDEKKRVDNIIKQLRDFRARSAHEQEAWESSRENWSTYLEGMEMPAHAEQTPAG